MFGPGNRETAANKSKPDPKTTGSTNRSITPRKSTAVRPSAMGNQLMAGLQGGVLEAVQKNQFVNELKEDELDGQLPKLKKVFLNGAEIPSWMMIKREFAQQKNLYREIDESKEEQEDFKNRDEFSRFEEVLKSKIAESRTINEKLSKYHSLT